MKIRDIRTRCLAIPHKRAYHWSIGAPIGTNSVVVEITTDEGVIGVGEASGTRSAVGTAAVIASVKHLLLDADPFRIEWLMGRLNREGNWSNQRRFANQAFAGIEMALFDICGKALGQPIYNLLGGRVRDEIHWFGFLQGFEPSELADDAVEFANRGFDVLYMKIGLEDTRDLAAVRAVRQAIGSEVRLRVDVNEAWDRLQARRMIRALTEFDIDWVEQPLIFHDFEGTRSLRQELGVPIALDQSIFTDYDVYRACSTDAADVIVVGFHETGGLLNLKKASAVASAAGRQINRHAVWGESSISTMAALQVLATIPNLTDGNQVMTGLFINDVLDEAEDLLKPTTRVPKNPGLGAAINWDRIDEFSSLFERVGQYHN
jgi:L-alanine-DL-glutamate epimerase-like enolase superfamily enzyme